MSKTKKPKREAIILQHPTMSTRTDVLSKTLLTTATNEVRQTDALQRNAVVGDIIDMLPQSASTVILSDSDKSLVEVFDKPGELTAEDRKRLVEHTDDDEVTAQLKAFYANEREVMSVDDEIEYWHARSRSRKSGENTLFCDESRYVAWLEFHTPPVVERGPRISRKSFWPITVRDRVSKVGSMYHLTHRPIKAEDGPEEFRRAIKNLKQRRGEAIDNVLSDKYLIAAVNAGFGPYRGETLPWKGQVRSIKFTIGNTIFEQGEPGLIEGYTSQCRYEDVMIEFFLRLDVSSRPENGGRWKKDGQSNSVRDFSPLVLSRKPEEVQDHVPKSYAELTDYAWYKGKLEEHVDESGFVLLLDHNKAPYRVMLSSIETADEAMWAWEHALGNPLNFGSVNDDTKAGDAKPESPQLAISEKVSESRVIADKPREVKLSKKQRKLLKKQQKLESQTLPAESGSLVSKAVPVVSGRPNHGQLYEQRQPRNYDIGLTMGLLKEERTKDRLSEVQIQDEAYQSLHQQFESIYNYLPNGDYCESMLEYKEVLRDYFHTLPERFSAYRRLLPLEKRPLWDKFLVEKTAGSCRREARQGVKRRITHETAAFLNSINPIPGQAPQHSTGIIEMRSNHPHSEVRSAITLAEKITSKTLEAQGLSPYNRLVGQIYREVYRIVDNAETKRVGPPEPVYAYGDLITSDGLPRAIMRVVGDFKVTETGLWIPTLADRQRLSAEKEEFGLWKWSMDIAKTVASALDKSHGKSLPIQLVIRVERPDRSVDFIPVTLPPELVSLIELGKKQQA